MPKCEHCGHDQESGRFCDACGMAVSKIRLSAESRKEKADAANEVQAAIICHRCNNVQMSGKICDQCGLKLDFYAAADEVAANDEDGFTMRCSDCGVMSKVSMCRTCGARIVGWPD